MSTTQWPSKIVPAQLSFLAIYNPTLGPTDDTFPDQLVFYYSRKTAELRTATKKNARNDGAGGDAIRREENEKLRQIGLAQGMVDFARSFSNGEPVDSVETEKSRMVLHELEKGWWILASIDLTRLPSLVSSNSMNKSGEKEDTNPRVEYSSREVSPPALLVQQLLQAHSIFSLHHGPSLDDLFVRLSRDKFCSTLERFWARFARSWDVLLHSNPAVDIFNGMKLASGGELGYGVGEEEYGSGEREVLEDLTRRTEGLVDVVVSRFGEPATTEQEQSNPEEEALPWMGSGNNAIASDGVVFGGVGALERRSLRDISLWIRQIYRYGEYAYGVRDNPSRERRKRRRKTDNSRLTSRNDGATVTPQPSKHEREIKHDDSREDQQDKSLATDLEPNVVRTSTTQSTRSHSNVPPPIVSAAEASLQKASHQAEQEPKDDNNDEDSGTTLGIPDQYMKYLTFGLSTFAKPAQKKRPPASRMVSTASSKAQQTQNKDNHGQDNNQTLLFGDDDDDMPTLSNLEPIPDGDALKAKIDMQKRLENKGHFLIGLSGDVDQSSEADGITDDRGFGNSLSGFRILLRTVQVNTVPRRDDDQSDDTPSPAPDETEDEFENSTMKNFRRLRVVIYVHRPFIYCFLFENRTSSLQYTSFYKTLHQGLKPIYKPLLSSTDVKKAEKRIETSHTAASGSESASISSSNKPAANSSKSTSIFDLIFDPRLCTVHTSIPNIPEPGTPAAEGILTSLIGDPAPQPSWTRIEAINVHSQILNTLTSVKGRKKDIERTSKTSRGWWVVWMKVPPSATATQEEADSGEQGSLSAPNTVSVPSITESRATKTGTEAQTDMNRIAFLVRKATDATSSSVSASTSSRAVSSMFGTLSMGFGSREGGETGGTSAGWGPAALAGGIGVDARKYVEGLLSLNR